MRLPTATLVVAAAVGVAAAVPTLRAQAPQAPAPAAAPVAAPQGRGNQAPPVNSQEVLADRKITFRIYAPNAQAVRLSAGDVPNSAQSAQMTKTAAGIWETTVGPVEPGAYRYNFVVDGVTVIDPASPFVSESNTRVWSMVTVPGADNLDT